VCFPPVRKPVLRVRVGGFCRRYGGQARKPHRGFFFLFFFFFFFFLVGFFCLVVFGLFVFVVVFFFLFCVWCCFFFVFFFFLFFFLGPGRIPDDCGPPRRNIGKCCRG